MSIIQGNAKGSSAAFYTKTIDQSLRLNDNDSAYLTRTPSSAGNRKTWTWSGWVKLGNTYMSLPTIFSADYGSQGFNLTTDFDTLRLYNYTTSYNLHLTSSLKIRDPSAWYHIVVAMDTTQATASDRVKVYLNGTQITNFATEIYPSQNFDTQVNAAVAHNFSKYSGQAGNYFDGYLAEIHLTDGTAYDADTFGELKSGIWIPKDPSVTYGTNGFYLDFANSADIGNDVSGNNNDWTVNNLVASDVVPDSPTNNFNVMNPALYVAGNNCTYSEGNLKVLRPVANWETVHSTMAVTSGKWYWEVYLGSTNAMVGICDPNTDIGELISVYTRAGLWNLHLYNGDIYPNGAAADTTYRGVATGTTGDVISVALDADNGRVYFGKNGTWFNSGDPAAGTGYLISSVTTDSGFLAPTLTVQAANDYQIINFGQDDTFAGTITTGGNSDGNGVGSFKYTVPSGFLALCTSNLPDPAIDPAQDATPEDHFNVVTYTGTGGTNAITGVGFQPDFVWTKGRNNAYHHLLYDAVRGATKYLQSSSAGAEVTGATTLISFDSDGYTLGAGDNSNATGSTNGVGWCWKAGGTGVSNTNGTITSTVSANTDAGFSIVGYTGNSTSGATVGHGLSSAPEMIIVKNRDAGDGWLVYHKGVASDAETDYLGLNTTNAAFDSTVMWNDTAPASSVFTLGNYGGLNNSVYDYIAYCFHSVDQFSKLGFYIGNGSSDGTFIYTGFRPKWVMVRRVDSGDEWSVWDDGRTPYNVMKGELFPNATTAESTLRNFDFVSNGFKLREGTYWGTTNANGGRYIYLAFAEQPFKYSNAR